MRYKFILLCALAQILCAANAFSQSAWDGVSTDISWYTGNESATEYTISTADELAGLSWLVKDGGVDFAEKTINIGSDPSNPVEIDLGGNTWIPIGYWTSSSVITPFRGSVNGNNCTIKNFRTSGSYRGLFGYVRSNKDAEGDDIVIRDINVESNVSGTQYVGGVCGYICGYSSSSTYHRNAKIVNCTFNGNVSASSADSYAGGIAGIASYVTIDMCGTAGSVSGANYVGGIVGALSCTSSSSIHKPILQNCVNSAKVVGRNLYVGGIAGNIKYSTLQYNVNGGNVSGTSQYTGGIVGHCTSTCSVRYCLNSGTVNQGGAISGGGGTLKNCYYDKQRQYEDFPGLFGSDDDVVGDYEGKLTRELTGISPSGISGTNWNADYWSFADGYYPVPKALEISNFAKLASASVTFSNTSSDYYYYNIVDEFNLCGGVSWTSGDPSFITISGSVATLVTPNGYTELTATIGSLTKIVVVNTRIVEYPLTINDFAELQAFRDAINGVVPDYKGAVSSNGFAEYRFKITADIVMDDADWTPIGTSLHPFSGFVDGQDNKISGLNISSSESYRGLFGYILSGTIRNLTVEGNVQGLSYVGGICGYLKGSNGDLVATIQNCHFLGNVRTTSTGSAYVGGVCGYAASYSDIKNSSATGAVESPNQKASYLGGIAGYVYGGGSSSMSQIIKCVNLADVYGNGYVGGIAGYVYRYTDFENNLNAGNIYGKTSTVGGLIGNCANNQASVISYNINAATVNSGSSVIGVFTDNGTIDDNNPPEYNYYDKQRSVLGGMNAADVSGRAEGLTTAEISGTSLDLDALHLGDWTITDGYPIPADFSNEQVKVIAKSTAKFYGDETYKIVGHNISQLTTDGVSWESDNRDIILDNGELGEGGYGNAAFTISKAGYSKKVLVNVAINQNPLEIANYAELVMFRNAVNAGLEGSYKGHANENGFAGVNFKVTDNIDMTDAENSWVAIGTSTNPFRGNFDGGSAEGHTISNMTISASGSYTGLFGYVYPTTTCSTIQNIELSGTISAKSYSGAIVGYAKGTNSTRNVVINNCHFNGTLAAAQYVGGICGYAGVYTTISNCTSAGTKITGSSTNVGGICGYSTGNATTKNVISGCASMSKNLRGTGTVGGIVGYAQNTDVNYNVNAAIVTANNSVVGGIAGNVLDGASLNECLNFITVFDIGKIYGTNAGTVTNCFYDSKHCVLGTNNGVAKTTAEMKALTSSTLNGSEWSFVSGSYPIPINIASHSSAKVACAPVTLGGTDDNQHVRSNYSICIIGDIAWNLTTTPASAAESITISGSDVTVGTDAFSKIVMIASLNGWEKQVTLTNSDFGSELLISSYAELGDFRTAVNNGSSGEYQGVANVDGFSGKTIKLTANLSITANWTPIGTAANPFKGTFDGQGYTISNLRHTSSSTPRGLFGYVENATIKNLNVKTGTGSTILKATTYCGGIVSCATKSTIQDCSFNGDITATSTWIGGIVGKMVSSTVRRCVTAGTIKSSTSNYVGGICGHASFGDAESLIEDCASNMDISGVSSIGGIAGYISNSKVQRCINAGNVSGATNNVGGIVGYETDDMAQVLNNLNAGTVYAGGGVVGFKHPDATVTNNYFDNQRSDLHGIAEVGEDGEPSDTDATGKQTVNLIGTQSLFASGWTETTDMYPVPSAIRTLDATKLAAVPVKLGTQKYNLVTENFNVGVMADLIWESSDDVYVSINQSTGLATVTTSTYNMTTLTAIYNGWKKTAKILKPCTDNPLPIPDVASLKDFRDAVNAGPAGSYMGVPNVGGFTGKNFMLTSASANYDLSGEANWVPIGKSSSYPFNGNFYGAGKNVIGLNVDAPEADNKGLFGYIIGGSISDLNVSGNVSGKSNVGGICGYIKGANSDNYAAINNCTFNGNVTAAVSYAGGIAGYNYYYSNIDTCRVAGAISAATSYAGGITGYSYGNSTSNINRVSSCTNAATVGCDGDYVGGIVGKNTNSRIEYCNNGGNVTGSRYLTGGITANNSTSGGGVFFCISTSLVNEGGAIVGYNQGTATGNFYDKQRTSVKGISTTDGTSSDQSGKAVGLLTEAMTGTSPSGLTGDGWIPLRWTFVDGSYPIPAVIASDDDFAVVTSIPVFLIDNWNTVNTTNSPFTIGDQTSTWGNNNEDYISISGTTATVSHPQELNSVILTPSLNGVSKMIFLCDYSTIPDLNIDNITDLMNFRDAVNNRGTGTYKGVLNNDGYKGVTFILTATIDLTGENWEPIGNTSDKGFSGIFNGNSNEIQNLTIEDYASDYAGLFGYVHGGEINDLKLTNVNIATTGSYVGALCGRIAGTAAANYSPISNCDVSGEVSSTGETNYVGGIVGVVASYANVANCTANVVVNAYSNAGGIAGYVSASNSSKNIIENCVNRGAVTASNNYAGGIVGYFKNDGIIYGCVNRGAVKALAYAGGIVGRMDGADSGNLFCVVDSCRNDNTVNATSSTSYAGGIVGYMYTYSKLKKSANSGAVTAKKYVGGIVASSPMTSHATKRNTITYCTNSATVVGTSTYVGGICGYSTYTDVIYNNNGGNVKTTSTTSTSIGGITGQNTEHSTMLYNISTGTVESKAVTENVLYGNSSTGTASENYYDNQRTKPISANGQNTSDLIGTAPSALTAEGWAENFIFNENMYPMPNGTQNYNEAKLAATPVMFTDTEVYDSVLNNITLYTENSVSWASGDEDHVSTSGAVTLKCSEPANIDLTASLADEDLTLNKIVTLKLAKVKILPVAEMSLHTPYYVWTGVESSYDWGTPDNWLQYDGTKYNYINVSPADNSNVVLIHEDESVCDFVSPVIVADKTLNNVLVEDEFDFNLGGYSLALAGEAIVNGAIIGNVSFEDGASCTGDGYIDGIIKKSGAGLFKFVTGHYDSDRSILLKSAFEFSVEDDDAEVSVHYTTNHDTYSMPDSYSHGGNMGGELDHVSDRDFWHIKTNKAMSNVRLYWRDRETPVINLMAENNDDCELSLMRIAYVTAGGSRWNEVEGETSGSCMEGYIEIPSFGGSSRSSEQEYDITLGSIDGEGKLVLPIELTGFTASCNGNSVDVKWTTASERNNDYFILERSYDAVHFSEAVRITGAGTSIEEHDYAFTDYEYYGGAMYYRLQQVDYDGKRSTSELIVVRCSDYELEPTVSVFPNPFRSEIMLSLANFANMPATVEVFDIMGTLVMTMDIDATGNDYATVLNLDNLSAATYTIRVSTAEFVINKRIVKQ
ncbi:MAG: T9SS type A sorting domain-containing protein [Bacteroidales bacterium]|nr:T9SS type A sorting domain-containing protein [Bacteroidales bacterium]